MTQQKVSFFRALIHLTCETRDLAFPPSFYIFVHMKQRRQTQKPLFTENKDTSYGGDLLKTRKGRRRGRPLDVRKTMHLVLRSTLAKGTWAFNKSLNRRAIERILQKFSDKYGVKILLTAYVGNHLHLHIKLSSRHA